MTKDTQKSQESYLESLLPEGVTKEQILDHIKRTKGQFRYLNWAIIFRWNKTTFHKKSPELLIMPDRISIESRLKEYIEEYTEELKKKKLERNRKGIGN